MIRVTGSLRKYLFHPKTMKNNYSHKVTRNYYYNKNSSELLKATKISSSTQKWWKTIIDNKGFQEIAPMTKET
jgi:hypothetical protein